MDEVSQEQVDDAWDEGFAHGYSAAIIHRIEAARLGNTRGAYADVEIRADEIERLRGVLQQITELSPFKSNTDNDSMLYENLYSHQRRYITQMLVKITALAHEALKEKE